MDVGAAERLAARAPVLLAEIQQTLYNQALAFRESGAYTARRTSLRRVALMAGKSTLGFFFEAWWCGDAPARR